MTRRAQALDQLYVAEIATVERFRRRGVASAMLAHAFDVAAVEGLAQVSLHVDSDNAQPRPRSTAGRASRCGPRSTRTREI